jgi:hypothetical protein
VESILVVSYRDFFLFLSLLHPSQIVCHFWFSRYNLFAMHIGLILEVLLDATQLCCCRWRINAKGLNQCGIGGVGETSGLRLDVLEAWRGEDVHLKKLETFSRLRKLPNPGFTGEGFFENQPHNSLQRGIEPEWSRPHLSSPSQLAACSFGWWLMAGAGLFWEKSTAGWLLVADLFWEKSTIGWWLISQANRARLEGFGEDVHLVRGVCWFSHEINIKQVWWRCFSAPNLSSSNLIVQPNRTIDGLTQVKSLVLIIGMPVVFIHCPYSNPHPPQMGRVWVENNYPLKKWGG